MKDDFPALTAANLALDDLQVGSFGYTLFDGIVMGPVRVKKMFFNVKNPGYLYKIIVTRESDDGEEVYTWRKEQRSYGRPAESGHYLQGDSVWDWPQRLVLGEHKQLVFPDKLGAQLSRYLGMLRPSPFVRKYLYLQYFMFSHPETGKETSMESILPERDRKAFEHKYDGTVFDEQLREIIGPDDY